jgi:hypothetical protein
MSDEVVVGIDNDGQDSKAVARSNFRIWNGKEEKDGHEEIS